MLAIGNHRVTCGNIADAQVDIMLAGEKVDVLYCDPPFGNMTYWQTLAKRQTGAAPTQITHEQLYDRMVGLIRRYVFGWVFIETGIKFQGYATHRLEEAGLKNIRSHVLKYQSGSSLLENIFLCGSTLANSPPFTFDPTPFRGAALPRNVVQQVAVKGGILLDPCCGMGYSARAAVANGMRFRGNEFNQHRLNSTIEFLRKTQ